MENLTLETKKSIMEDFFCHFRRNGILEYLEAAGFYEARPPKGTMEHIRGHYLIIAFR